MQTVAGTVRGITVIKQGTGRRGPWTLWGADIDGTQVKVGFQKPAFNVGDQVSLQCEQNRYGDIEVITPGKPVGGASKPAPKPAGTGQAGGRGYDRTFPVAKRSPEMAIIRQNALTNANATLSIWAQATGNKLPKDPEELAELIITLAYEYADFSSGQREVKAMEQVQGEVVNA